MNHFKKDEIVELKKDYWSSNLLHWETAKVIKVYEQYDEIALEVITPEKIKGKRFIEYASHLNKKTPN